MKAKSLLYLFFIALLISIRKDIAVVFENEEGENPLTPDEWFSLQRTWPYNYIDYQAVKKAREYLREAKQKNNKEALTADWVYAGPTNVYGGRVTDIEMPAGSNKTVYVAAASGGIFKSYNLGSSWFPVFDDQPALSIGDIAISPVDTNVIYAGSGEPNAGGGSMAYDGDGVYRSQDGGSNWQNIGLNDCGSTGKIAINPHNPNIVYAAMMGTLFANNPQRGIYKSNNSGNSWQQSLFVSDSTGGIDVVMDPVHPDTVYACLWERIRRPDRRMYGGPTSAIYRSFNGGSNWIKLTSLLPSQNKGRISLAINPQNPAILYASVVDPNGALIDIYKTTNYGNTWTATNSTGYFSITSYDWWFGGIRIDPNNPSRLYMLLMNAYASMDGGQSWTMMANSAHVDHHALCFMPQAGHMILGNDGGVNFTTNYFQTYTGIIQQNLPIAQLYAIDVANWDSSYIIIGAQDNNVFRKYPVYGNQWHPELGGDGVNCRINQLAPPEGLYMSYQYGGFYFTGNTLGGYYPFGFLSNERFNWKSPIVASPVNALNVYVAGNHVYKSTDQGQSFNAISPDLSNGPGTYPVSFGTVTAMAVAASNENYIYVGTDDGNLRRTNNSGNTWTSINAGLPHRWVTSLKIHPQDPNKAWVTYSGYRYGDNIAHVYYTQNGGTSWTSISGNLPDVPVNDIVIDTFAQGLYYLATDIGVFITQDAGQHWSLVGQAMPNLPVIELNLHYPTHTLFAATYGRGIFKLDLSGYTGIAAYKNQITANVYPNPFQAHFNVSISVVKPGNYKFVIYDVQGKVCYSVSFYLDSGLQTKLLSLPPGPAGLYYLAIQSSAGEKVIKLLRQ